jgi:hypothetical protein
MVSLIFSVAIAFSCTKRENMLQNNVEITDELVQEEGNYEQTEEIMYVNSLEGLRVRKEPSIESERLFLLDDNEKVLVLEKNSNEYLIDGIKGNWFLIKTDKITGWVFSGYLINQGELRPNNIGMNKIEAVAVILKEFNGNLVELKLNNDEGTYRYNYGINIVTINYWKKTAEFDARYQYDNRYYPDEYTQMENNIENGINDFNSVFFNQNIAKNEINDIIFVDSFCFAVFEAESIFLSRRIYLSTGNYNIRITIQGQNELNNKIIEEVPNYFRIGTAGLPAWNSRESRISFGNDLIDGIHSSETANIWYLETEEIINGIIIK